MLDPRSQDNKNDFQKQNIRELVLNGMVVVRGHARWGMDSLVVLYTASLIPSHPHPAFATA